MRARHQAQNLYKSVIKAIVPAIGSSWSLLDEFAILCETPPKNSNGWVFLEYETQARRNLIYYHRKDGNNIYYYRKNRDLLGNGWADRRYEELTSIQQNDVAELANFLSTNFDDFWYTEYPYSTTNSIMVYGGKVRLFNTDYTIWDVSITLNNGTSEIVFDYTDRNFKAIDTSALATLVGMHIATAVVSNSIITSVTDMRVLSLSTKFASAFFDFATGIVDLKDGSITSAKLAAGIQTILANTSWVNTWDQVNIPGKSAYTDALNTVGGYVSVNSSWAPTAGQVLMATWSGNATWQTLDVYPWYDIQSWTLTPSPKYPNVWALSITDTRVTTTTPYLIFYNRTPVSVVTTMLNGSIYIYSTNSSDNGIWITLVLFGFGSYKTYTESGLLTLNWAGPRVITDDRVTATMPLFLSAMTESVGILSIASWAWTVTISSTGTESGLQVKYIVFRDITVAEVSDEAFWVSWSTDTKRAASRKALYDKLNNIWGGNSVWTVLWVQIFS